MASYVVSWSEGVAEIKTDTVEADSAEDAARKVAARPDQVPGISYDVEPEDGSARMETIWP